MSSVGSIRPGARSGVAVHGAMERCEVREARILTDLADMADLESYRAYVAHVSHCRKCRPQRCAVGAALCRDYLTDVQEHM
jgi:hypothetical protein